MNFLDMELTDFLKRIFPQIAMLATMYLLVLSVIFLDLWAGIRKAKIRGEFRSSFGLRKTVEKIGKYYNMIFVLTVIDAMQMLAIGYINPQVNGHIPIIPIFTFVGSIFVGFIELKSVYEKAEDKEKNEIAQTAKIVGKVITDISVQELASKVAEYLKNNQTNEHEHENKH
jgi:hypothetical protein